MSSGLDRVTKYRWRESEEIKIEKYHVPISQPSPALALFVPLSFNPRFYVFTFFHSHGFLSPARANKSLLIIFQFA